jgi:hypothetical protein
MKSIFVDCDIFSTDTTDSRHIKDCIEKKHLCWECLTVAKRDILDNLLRNQFLDGKINPYVQFLLQHGDFERYPKEDEKNKLAYRILSGISYTGGDFNSWPIDTINVEALTKEQFQQRQVDNEKEDYQKTIVLEYRSLKNDHPVSLGPQSNGNLPYEGERYVIVGKIFTRDF